LFYALKKILNKNFTNNFFRVCIIFCFIYNFFVFNISSLNSAKFVSVPDHFSDVIVNHWSPGIGTLRSVNLATAVQALRMQ
jgi:hypothetical protein